MQPSRQVGAPALDGGRAGGQLPTGDALVQDALETGGEDHDPDQREAVPGSGHGRRHDVAGADAGRRDEQTGADRGERRPRGGRASVGAAGQRRCHRALTILCARGRAAGHGDSQRRRSRRAHARPVRRPPHLRPVRRHEPAVLRRALPDGARHHARAHARRAQRRLHGRRLRARQRAGPACAKGRAAAAPPICCRGWSKPTNRARRCSASPPTCRCSRAAAIR